MTARFALKRGWQVFTRLRVTALLIFALLVLAALGSCFPQLSAPVASEGERLQAWQTAVQSRFGGLTGALAAIGLFDWFHSPLFLLSLALLALATLVCTLNRWSFIWGQTVRQPEFPSDRAFEVAPHIARLNSGATSDSPLVLRRSLEERGFQVRTRAVEDRWYLRGDRNRWASAATLLTHGAVLLLLSGGIVSGGLGWREELTLEPGATAKVGHGSALALSNQGFAITRYPDGSVAAYQAQVALLDQGRQIVGGNIEVNAPLTYRGLAFYLNGYNLRGDTGYSLTLLAVRDPGYGLVIAAGFALLLSMAISFNFPRCWIQARVEAGGALTLAGWADRHAWEFECEFEALVKDLAGSQVESRVDERAGKHGLGWAVSAAALAGWGLLTASLVRRALTAGHWPLTNRYEFALCWVWAILAIYLLLAAGQLRGRMVALPAHASAGVLAVASLVAVYALTRSPDQRAVAPLLPALRSPWLQIHVLSTLVGYAAFGVAAGLGLASLTRRAVTGDHLARTMERSVALGFPWLTLGILTGAIWAQNAWGRYWGWDPKETWALITWLWYLLALHLRPLPGWRGRRLAGLVVAGFGMVLFTFIGVPWLVRLVRLESLHGF